MEPNVLLFTFAILSRDGSIRNLVPLSPVYRCLYPPSYSASPDRSGAANLERHSGRKDQVVVGCMELGRRNLFSGPKGKP